MKCFLRSVVILFLLLIREGLLSVTVCYKEKYVHIHVHVLLVDHIILSMPRKISVVRLTVRLDMSQLTKANQTNNNNFCVRLIKSDEI